MSKKRNYDNSRRKLLAEQRKRSEEIRKMLQELEKSEEIHPDSMEEALKKLKKAEYFLIRSENMLRLAVKHVNESARVRNQRNRRRNVS